MESPISVEMLARCNAARQETMKEIDLCLLDSLHRDSYGVTEVRNLLLDLRRKLDDVVIAR